MGHWNYEFKFIVWLKNWYDQIQIAWSMKSKSIYCVLFQKNTYIVKKPLFVIAIIFGTSRNFTFLLKCYKIEHSFEICHWAWSSKLSCKILRRYDQPFLRKWRLKLLLLVVFRIFPNGNSHFCPGLWKVDVTLRGCTSCRVTVLVLFVSVKPEARHIFG